MAAAAWEKLLLTRYQGNGYQLSAYKKGRTLRCPAFFEPRGNYAAKAWQGRAGATMARTPVMRFAMFVILLTSLFEILSKYSLAKGKCQPILEMQRRIHRVQKEWARPGISP